MPEEDPSEYSTYLEERKQLIDAARESVRTFDKAVLTFGSAIFAFSIAFVKDVAPKPLPYTLKWLASSWLLFSLGLLVILFSFLFSHQACLKEIEIGAKCLGTRPHKTEKNTWSVVTTWCNFLSIAFLFLGLLFWCCFALGNLANGDAPVNKVETSVEKKGYVPPSQPAKPPQQPQAPTQPPPGSKAN